MKYLIIGTGGTGGCIGGYMTRAGLDVSFIARGESLRVMNERGLTVKGGCFGEFSVPVKAFAAGEPADTPDVIFICVKAYSLSDAAAIVKQHADKNTVIIPILNGIDIYEQVSGLLPGYNVLKACMYITAAKTGPGIVENRGNFFKVVLRDHNDRTPEETVRAIAGDLQASSIEAIISGNIDRDVYKKFMFISPLAAAQCCYDVPVGGIREDSEKLEFYLELVKELGDIAGKQGVELGWIVREQGIREIEARPAGMYASLLLDVKAGKTAETDGLIMAPIRLGKQYGVPTPAYEKAASVLGL